MTPDPALPPHKVQRSSGGRWGHWWKVNPLLVLALAAVAGICLEDRLALRLGWLLAGASAAVLAAGIWHRRLWALLPGTALLFACLHSWRLEETFAHPLRLQLLQRADHAAEAGIRGRLLPWTDGGELDETRAVCDVTALRWGAGGDYQPAKARLKVVLPEGFQLRQPGVYEMEGTLTLGRPAMNPGQFDSTEYGLRMGWVAQLRAREVRLAEARPWSAAFHLLHLAETSRQWMSAALARGLEKDEEAAAVIQAMALGASDAAGEDIEDAFRDSGTLHVFAVSGLHVVMVAGVLGWLLRGLGMGKNRAALLLIVMIFGYAFITGWRPSAARAAFMIAIVLAAPLWNRKARVENNLGAAALVLLAYDTHQLFAPGFQLSFIVLWAIVAWVGYLLEPLRPWTELDPFLPPHLADRRQRLFSHGRGFAAGLVCSSVAAWAGSLLPMLGHFRTVTPVGLVANLVLVPASGICIIASCLSLVFSAGPFGWVQFLVNQVNLWVAKLMVWCALWFSSWPYASVSVDLRQGGGQGGVEMRVFHLTGGAGAACLRAGASHWLLDTGNAWSWRGVVRPCLRLHGINELHGMVLSHGDIAHVGAAPQARRMMSRPVVHTSRHEPWRYDPPLASLRHFSRQTPPDTETWQRHLQDGQIQISPSHATATLPVKATVLHPRAADVNEKADDRTLVLMLEIGRTRILWLNDAGFITEKRLLERGLPVQCDIVIRHQHAADISGLTELLAAARPQVVVSSSDSRFPEQTLPPRLRDYCAQKGITLFDTEKCGSVNLEFQAEGAEAEAFVTGQRVMVRAGGRGP